MPISAAKPAALAASRLATAAIVTAVEGRTPAMNSRAIFAVPRIPSRSGGADDAGGVIGVLSLVNSAGQIIMESHE
jgi:hypothetical protein